MSDFIDEFVGLIVAMIISATLMSIGLTTNTPLSQAFTMAGSLGLIVSVVGFLGLGFGKGRS